MTKPKILITCQWPQAVFDRLKSSYDMTVADQKLDKPALMAAITQYDAICATITDRLDAEVLATPGAATKIIGNFGAGFEHIDCDAARRAGIMVTNTPDVTTQATAQLAILLMLMASRRAGEGERELRSGNWTGWRPTHMMGADITGKVLGLVGFGRIAQATAEIAINAFNMSVLYHSRKPAKPESEILQHAEYCASLDDMVARADVVSLHCPGGAATHHLMNRQRLSLMKSTAILVNTARGSIVDEAALADALSTGMIASAGLDVYEYEPHVSPALLALENVVLLPHMGSATLETRTAMGMRVADNLDAFFNGQEPKDRVV